MHHHYYFWQGHHRFFNFGRQNVPFNKGLDLDSSCFFAKYIAQAMPNLTVAVGIHSPQLKHNVDTPINKFGQHSTRF
jgi:hypothetical protein